MWWFVALLCLLGFSALDIIVKSSRRTAFAQSTTGAPNSLSRDAANQQKAKQPRALTVEKLKQDLQKTGCTEAKVLEDAFLIQAKTKDGRPILTTIGPNGMSPLEVSNLSGGCLPRTTGQAPPDNIPASAPAKTAQN